MSKQNMLINLEPRSISASTNLPHELEFMGDALQHQVDVFEQSRDANIILDLAPTGTGKTKAGFTVLLHQPNSSAIYIAPTNALVHQQTEAASKFVKEAGLPHVVKSASAKDIKGWSNDKVGRRSGEKLYNVLRNPSTIFPEVGANKPILLVTNPDIFYYATFFTYNRLDRDNIASSFYTQFATVIIDEFHLYDAKKLVGLLFYIAYFHIFGFFKHQRRVVLLTATPEPACEAALESLGKQGVRIARVDGEYQNSSNLLPSQTAVNLELRPIPEKKDDFLSSITSQVVQLIQEKPNHNGAVILDSKDHINRLADILKARGLDGKFGRITGSTPQLERQSAAQKQIILATSTVDVGFNFEKTPAPTRQNLDWLIFSARERASFWQRLGRVGRVLGKTQTDIASLAIAYLPNEAWQQGLENLDITGGRNALKTTLESLRCLDKPFLRVYWCSEAFLEIARPLLELEVKLEGLDGSEYIPLLFNTMRETLGGKRTWDDYRWRMKILQGAENIANASVKNIKKDWKYIKGGQALLSTFIKVHSPDDWEDIQTKRTTLTEYEKVLLEDEDFAEELCEFAEIWRASYSPLFQFRDSLFESLNIYDPHGLLLDELDETILDPIHLLRYYEFGQKDELIQVTARAAEIYEISFRLRYHGELQDFVNTQLNKLTAFRNCHIIRRLEGAVSPTPLLKELEKSLLPGVIICPTANAAVVFQLRKLGVISYPIKLECNDFSRDYIILPGLSGILTLAMKYKQLKLPDNECFIACL
ncbi:MAG: type I-D CRISPR-associated helicase Cas3' [Calothrix sp. FI2-JRJ7]|jgi:CRISPR-associated endonuclease/helicase Cas3|nr:type I-D CRISPR-associated helicase Cas3' [Calothrix sp. FI2-JRJ7]